MSISDEKALECAVTLAKYCEEHGKNCDKCIFRKPEYITRFCYLENTPCAYSFPYRKGGAEKND